jgi:hypothetical protein
MVWILYMCVIKLNILFYIRVFPNELINLPVEDLFIFKAEEDNINGVYLWVSWKDDTFSLPFQLDPTTQKINKSLKT